MRSVLVIEDDRDARYALRRVLEEAGYSVFDVGDPSQVKEVDGFDLLVLDLKLGRSSGLDFLRRLREEGKNIPVVVITAYANPENIISASRYGAIDILKKPFEKGDLLEVVERIINDPGVPQRIPASSENPIIGESKSMLEVFKKVGLAASTDMNVLLVGETGVGKDLLAKTIHENSGRKDFPFLAINCSAIPENLLEAELFGYKKGAFTGAIKDAKGKVELGEGGTLFLDEIGDMPYSLQAKLLRFLENKKFYRLGDEKEREANIRVISATNRDLRKMIEVGKFREDLYYRLSQIVIEIPPLRERKEDIPFLIDFFIGRANEEFGTEVQGLSDSALKEALDYEWKGNVRELKNLIYKVVLETRKGYVEKLPLVPSGEEKTEDLIDVCIRKLKEEEFRDFLPEVERRLLGYLMERYEGNKSRVARVLGISRNTLKSKLKALGL